MHELSRVEKRKPLLVVVPGNLCEVPECENIKQSDMVVLFLKQQTLELYQVCGRHRFLWQGRASFFPLNRAPDLNWVAREVEKEIARRNPPQPMYYGSNNVFTATTGTYNMYFRFD